MTPSIRPRRALAAVALALAAVLLAALPALAHTALVGSSPEEGETVTALDEVSLEFTEQLLEIGTELALEAPDGTVTALEVEEPITETVTAAVPAGALGDGAHVLRFRVVASDGHPIEGEIAFTVEAPPGSESAAPSATAAPAEEASPASSTPTPAPTGSAAEGATESDTESGTDRDAETDAPPEWALIAFGVAGAAALAAAIVVAARRGRPRD